jgi:uncharacterized protein YbjQ (UPF0145 family)
LPGHLVIHNFAGPTTITPVMTTTTTTPTVEGRRLTQYLGIVTGEAIVGANAVIGVDLDYEVLGAQNGMLMVSASGTAVCLG